MREQKRVPVAFYRTKTGVEPVREWLKSLNRFPFEVQSLPAASFNLIQQVGRLIRSHSRVSPMESRWPSSA